VGLGLRLRSGLRTSPNGLQIAVLRGQVRTTGRGLSGGTGYQKDPSHDRLLH
jgi:hypothetical protein